MRAAVDEPLLSGFEPGLDSAFTSVSAQAPRRVKVHFSIKPLTYWGNAMTAILCFMIDLTGRCCGGWRL